MSGYDAIIGQKLPIRLLKQFLLQDTIPHALLFTGIAGVGKRSVAQLFAMALNCQTTSGNPALRPCGSCRSCRQIVSGNDPDVLCIEPQKNILRIDQIRKLLTTLAMKPFGSGRRVVLVGNAQTLNPEAGNALLKVLEEPPPNTVLILTATQRSDLLPTIVSRCRHIHFDPIAPDDLVHLLMTRIGMERGPAIAISEQADGSFEKASSLAANPWTLSRDWLVHAAGLDQPKSKTKPPVSLALAFAAQLAQCKENIKDLLDILKTWIRDLAVVAYASDRIVNQDRRPVLEQVRQGLSDQHLVQLWEAIENAQKEISGNANLRLTLDVMALRISGWMAA